jgi:hypothetical protein
MWQSVAHTGSATQHRSQQSGTRYVCVWRLGQACAALPPPAPPYAVMCTLTCPAHSAWLLAAAPTAPRPPLSLPLIICCPALLAK